jgi:outer membrane beta-barrel protein
LAFALVPAQVFAAEANTGSPAPQSGDDVAVEKIRERYWAQGKEAEVGVVQNRIYSKKNKLELSINGGKLSGDPFLSTFSVGGSAGFYFSEYLSAHAFAWKAFVSPSSALSTLKNDLNTTTNTNEPRSFFGGELRGSLLYGKLSLIGQAILYFDAYITAGLGSIATESGSNLGYFLGIGQQIHVSQLFAVNLDYRFMQYDETIIGKVPGASYGQTLGNRTNQSGMVTLGVSLFLGL